MEKKRLKEDKHILGFRDSEKMDKIPNTMLSMVITALIANHGVSMIINDRSSCNIMYARVFMRLGL